MGFAKLPFALLCGAVLFLGARVSSANKVESQEILSKERAEKLSEIGIVEELDFDWSEQGLLLYANRPKDTPVYAAPRHLQTTCLPYTANGVWSGQPPNLNAQGFCGNFYWNGYTGVCRSVYASTTFTLACSPGYYRSSSNIYGTCNGDKNCCYDSSQGYSGSCTHVCIPLGYWDTRCIYCCKCNNYFSFSYPGTSCLACYPPAAPNAANPAYVAGTASYQWTCQKGYYGTPVTRTCSSTDGSWSGSAITCTPCSASSAPANGQLTKPDADLFQYQCNPGYFFPGGPSSVVSQRCDTTTGAMTPALGTFSCSACNYDGTNGMYCTGLSARLPCRGGYYGSPGALSTSDTCSGQCIAGYYCPAGSTSSTQFACGGVDKYCPAGSSQPIVVSANHYTTPINGPPNTRTGQAPCPAGRDCAGGVILPGINLPDCDANQGRIAMVLRESTTGVPIGTPIAYKTGTVTGFDAVYSVIPGSFTFADSTCSVTAGMFSFTNTPSTANTGSESFVMNAGMPLDYNSCQNGFLMKIKVARTDSATSNAAGFGPIEAVCTIDVTVLQVAKPPIITACGDRTVDERTVPGTLIGGPLAATNLNVGTSLLWTIDYTLSPNVPISIGLCDAQPRVLKTFLYRDYKQFTINVIAKNDGSAIGIGSAQSTCSFKINVRMVPLPPVLTTTAFYVPELKDIPYTVGNVGATDPNNYTISSYSFSRSDRPNAFAVDRFGNITGTYKIDTITELKTVWNYDLNVSNGFAWAVYPITISLLPVPRPPLVAAQTINVRDDSPIGWPITPAATASHPQGLPITFSLGATNNPIGIYPNGSLYAKAAIDYYAYQTSTPLPFTMRLALIATDSLSQSTTNTLTVQLVETNKPPYFVNPQSVTSKVTEYNYVVNEGTPFDAVIASAGAVLPTAPKGMDPNRGDRLTYSVTAANPPIGTRTFSVDPFNAEIRVGSIASSTGGMLMYDRTLTYPMLHTFQLNLQVMDQSLTAAATAYIKIANIKPRFDWPVANPNGVFQLPQTFLAKDPVIDLGSIVWGSFGKGPSNLDYTISPERTEEGETAFYLDVDTTVTPATAIIRIAEVPIYSGGSGGSTDPTTSGGGSSGTIVGYGPPNFNYNTKNSFIVNITATNKVDGARTTVSAKINLQHKNRPPRFVDIVSNRTVLAAGYRFNAFSGELADVGNPLIQKVDDPDIATGLGESFTFAITAGNQLGGYGIDAATGQLSVVNDNVASTKAANAGGDGFVNLTIKVTDNGLSGGPAYSAYCWVYVSVTDFNHRPFFGASRSLPSPTFTFRVNEFATDGTLVGSIDADDFEGSDKLTYTSISPRGDNVNRPFQFTVVTDPLNGKPDASGKPRGRGLIKVKDFVDSSGKVIPIDWNELFKFYNATITVCDNYPSLSLCNTAPVNIEVNLLSLPPYFDLVNRKPNSKVFLTKIDEYSSPGAVLNFDDTPTTPALLTGTSKDPWRRPNLRYAWAPNQPDAALFTLNAITAGVTIANGVTPSQLDFNVKPLYTLTIVMTDDNVPPLTDTATVKIALTDVNNPSKYDGLYTAMPFSAATKVAKLSVSEIAAAGTTFGYVRFTDQDITNIAWGTLKYSIVASPGTSNFAINEKTGALMVADGATFDYWDQTSYTFEIMAQDSDFTAPISVKQAITVDLIQANRVRVTGFQVPSGIAPAASIPVDGSAYATSHAGNSVLFNTLGHTGTQAVRVEILGTGFGPTVNRPNVVYSVSATYGTTGVEYKAANCVVVTKNILIRCDVAPGIGKDHVWRVTVTVPADKSWTSPDSTARTAYFPPTITSVFKSGANTADLSAHTIATNGTDSLVVTGFNMGPSSSTESITLIYGNELVGYNAFKTLDCTWVTSQQVVRCPSSQGVGRDFGFIITVGRQPSLAFALSPVRYRTPVISSVKTDPAELSTDGRQGETISVFGDDFGPGLITPTLSYSADFTNTSWYDVFTAGLCKVVTPHKAFTCASAPGIGGNLKVRLTVANQTSAPSSQGIKYKMPVITDLGGQGRDNADTAGKQEILLYGDQLGPKTPLNSAGFPIAGFLQPRAFYGKPGVSPMKYEAANCYVAAPNTRIRCETAPGTGRGHVWKVVVGEQSSLVYTNKTSSYGPPVVASYIGDGAKNALTEGDQYVVIKGLNFGPAGTLIDLATYGSDENSTSFIANNCTLQTPNTEIRCLTTVGAGAGLKWKVTIDGQISVTPSTDYGPPQIQSFGGPGAVDASTNGGDVVLINGAFLSIQKFLESVTYGPGGLEYRPKDCVITIPHKQIACTLLPGFGRRHSWFVTVGGQTSALSSTLFTSYALPQITSISPINVTTAGTAVAVIKGTNFAINSAKVTIRINDGTAVDAANPRPSQADLDDHWAAVAAGDIANYKQNVLAWIARFQTMLPITMSTLSGVPSGHQIEFKIPEGFGLQRELIVMTGSVPSNLIRFDFVPPVITNVAPDRQQVPFGFLRIQLDGTSFCNINKHQACGDVRISVDPTVDANGMLINGQSVIGDVLVDPMDNSSRLWKHNYIAFRFQDTSQAQSDRYVQVVVNGVPSNVKSWRRLVPSINGLVTQPAWQNMDTRGGERFFIDGVQDIYGAEDLKVFIGPNECTNVKYPFEFQFGSAGPTGSDAAFKVECITPPGLGGNNFVSIRTSAGASSDVGTGIIFKYAVPRIDKFTLGSSAGAAARMLQAAGVVVSNPTIPTLGSVVTIFGRYFGLSNVSAGADTALRTSTGVGEIISRTDTVIVASIPKGDGASQFMNLTISGQSTSLGYGYNRPNITWYGPSTGPTFGGGTLTFKGMDFGVSPSLPPFVMPVITIGTRVCPITSPLPHVNHSLITCTLPAGYGVNLPVKLVVNGQESYPGATFSYYPPTVLSALPANGPTSGMVKGPFIDDLKIFSHTGERIVMIIRGDNFGRSGTITFEPTEDSGSLDKTITVDPKDVLPMNVYQELMATKAMGRFDKLAGVTISQARYDELHAAAYAMSANPSDPSNRLVIGDSLATDSQFRHVSRMWNETHIALLMPAGYGSRLAVKVNVKQDGASQAIFDYDAPRVAGVIAENFDNILLKRCLPSWQLAELSGESLIRNLTSRLKKIYPGCYPTNGGFNLIVSGESFGPSLAGATTVWVGDKPCAVLGDRTKEIDDPRYPTSKPRSRLSYQSGHDLIFCAAPPGYGENLTITVTVGKRSSLPNDNARLSYDPPVITGHNPNRPDAIWEDGKRLGIYAKNLAPVETETVITINNDPCDSPKLETSGYITCDPGSGTVGAKNVTMFTANRTEPAVVLDVEELLVYKCYRGYYGLESEVCLKCPQGAVCPGEERFVDMVYSQPKFWRTNFSSLSAEAGSFCDPERLTTREACPAFQACEPVESCLGNNTCAYGYDGPRCMFCLKGKFYRVDGKCIECPANTTLLYVGLAFVLLAVIAFAYWLNKKRINLALVAIGVDYFQVVAMFSKARIDWPPELRRLFNYLQIFNLNIDIVAPECLNPNLSYHMKWFFIEALPLLIIAAFLIISLGKIAYKLAFTSKRKSQLTAHLPTLISTSIVVFRLMYLYLVKTSMDALSCLATEPPEFRIKNPPSDPIMYVAGQLDYPCWTGWHLVLFPMGIGTLLLYGIALPLLALWYLRKNKDIVKYDQILRAKGTGDDLLSNPHYRFRKAYSKLYYHFRPGKMFWEFVILARKFLVALTALMFRQVGSYQLAMCLLVLFVAFVLQTQHLPYMTTRNKKAVVDEHLAKALAGDRLHARLESEMRANAKKNQRKRVKQSIDDMVSGEKGKDFSVVVVLYFCDANTVEALLLGSAILVNLLGIMLDSRRFSGDNRIVNYAEYTAIAISTIVIIAFTIAYYVTVFALELIMALCPARLNPVISCLGMCIKRFSKKNIQAAMIKAKAQNGRGKGLGEDGAVTTSDMQVNAMMLRGSMAVKDGEDITNGGILDAKQIATIDSPTPMMWKAVQASYGTMYGMLEKLNHEIRDLKHIVEEQKGTPMTAPLANTLRTRTQFKPTIRAVDDGDSNQGFGDGSVYSGTNPLLSAGGGTAAGGAASMRTRSAGLKGFASSGALALKSVKKSPKIAGGQFAKTVEIADDAEESHDAAASSSGYNPYYTATHGGEGDSRPLPEVSHDSGSYEGGSGSYAEGGEAAAGGYDYTNSNYSSYGHENQQSYHQ